MPAKLTDAQRKLLDDKNLAYVATLSDNGEPQITPVWIEYDGTYVLFNTEEKRAKVKHMKKNPRVAVCVTDAEDTDHYIEIRGTVIEMTNQGADEMLARLTKKYLGVDVYPYARPGDVRLAVKILPEKILGMGG